MLKILTKAATLQGGTRRLFCLLLVTAVLIPAGLAISPVSAEGPPGLPAIFYGTVTVSGSSAPVGTVILSQINSVNSGTFTTTAAGSYGNMLVTNGNDGDTVQFYVNGVAAQTAVYHPGEINQVNLSTGGGGSAPSAPVLSLPASGATGVSITPTLQWTASSGATSYTAQVSNSSSFATITFSQSGITGTSVTVSPALASGTLYYWRANATNAYGTSVWATARSFTTASVPAPSAPTLLSPSNGATAVAASPLLQWNASTGATSYTVQVSTSSSFSSFAFTLSGSATAATVTPALSSSTIYYWRANATGAGGTSPWSSTWSFTTNGGSTPTVPAFFKGAAYKDGTAVNGKQVCAVINSGSSCATSDSAGNYLVSVSGSYGDAVTFRVDGSTATETATFSPGWMTTLDLHATSGGPLAVTTTSLPSGTTGSAYSTTLTASGGSLPYTWSIASGSLPAWASLNASTGVISGSTPTAGTSTFTVRVTDAVLATSTSGSLSITISAPGTLTVTTTSLPSGTVGTAYSTALSATGGSTPYTWSIASGSLPAWASLNASTGVISGSTPTAGTSTFTARVTDATLATATSVPLSISISAPGSLAVSTTSLPSGCVGFAYSTTLVATGGSTPYTWAVTSGSLPAWASLNSSTGAISGSTPTAGTSTFTVTVTDAAMATATSGSLSISISTCSSDPIGSTSSAAFTNGYANYVYYGKYAANATTSISKIYVSFVGAGNATAAIYSDSSGKLGTKLASNDTAQAVSAGVQSITIPTTNITAGTTYWLAVWSNAAIVGFAKETGTYGFTSSQPAPFVFPTTVPRVSYIGPWEYRLLISGSN